MVMKAIKFVNFIANIKNVLDESPLGDVYEFVVKNSTDIYERLSSDLKFQKAFVEQYQKALAKAIELERKVEKLEKNPVIKYISEQDEKISGLECKLQELVDELKELDFNINAIKSDVKYLEREVSDK